MTDEETQAARWGRALGSAFLTDAPYLTTHLGLLGPVILGDVTLVAVSVLAYLLGRLLPYFLPAPASVADHWHRSEFRRQLPHTSSLALLLAAMVLMAARCDANREAARDDQPQCKTSPMTTLPSNSVIGLSPLLGNSGVRPTGFRDGRLGLQKPAPGNLFAGSEFWGAKQAVGR